MTTWVQAVALEWRPELRFFETRSEILRELEREDSLEQFGWGVDRVNVKVADYLALSLGVNGAFAWILSPKEEAGRLHRAVDVALGMLEPRDVVFAHARFRHLAEIKTPASQAQQQTSSVVLGHSWTDARPTDFALLLDGASSRVESRFQVEFGVVSAEEIRFRFSHAASRLGPLEPPFEPDLDDVPESAVFLDWIWPGRVEVGREAVASRWTELLDEANRLSTDIWRYLVGNIMEEQEERG